MIRVALDRRQDTILSRGHPAAAVRSVVMTCSENFNGRHQLTLRQLEVERIYLYPKTSSGPLGGVERFEQYPCVRGAHSPTVVEGANVDVLGLRVCSKRFHVRLRPDARDQRPR